MKYICEGCGVEQDEHVMMSYSTGRHTHWFCWECWKAGQDEAAAVEIKNRNKKEKEWNK